MLIFQPEANRLVYQPEQYREEDFGPHPEEHQSEIIDTLLDVHADVGVVGGIVGAFSSIGGLLSFIF